MGHTGVGRVWWVGHLGVEWVMQGWGGFFRGGVGHIGVGLGGSYRVGWCGSCRGGVGGSCSFNLYE